MGYVLSKFRKTKPSTKDVLEKIEADLRKLSRFQFDTEIQQKRIVGKLILCGTVLYIIVLVLLYFFGPRGLSWQETLLWITPLILFPFILIGTKRSLNWYFDRKIAKNKEKYAELKKEKQRLLDDVMENETFKVAKEILEKYAPNHLLPKYLADQQRNSPSSLTPILRAGGDGLRRRNLMTSTPIPYQGQGNMGGMTPRQIRPYGPPGMGPGQFLRQPMNNFGRPPAIMPAPGSMPRGPPPPRFMLPPPPTNPQFRTRKTGWVDKLVDYVVGDGPSNRFALICRYCATHNGLATPDDFPYIGYRCVYCRQFNPPRQQRPSAATLPKNTVLIEEMDTTLKSPENSVNDGNESETAENKESEENTDVQEQDTEAKTEDGNEVESEKENDDPLVELAASSVEDLRKSTESLQVEEQSGNFNFADDTETETENEVGNEDTKEKSVCESETSEK